MKEHPILFSGEMVRAILDGRKTQTRRTRGLEQMNRHPDLYDKTRVDADGKLLMRHKDGSWVINWGKSPYGVPGDRLWGRETWNALFCCSDMIVRSWSETPKDQRTKENLATEIVYRSGFKGEEFGWVPSIFMNRWASRITLEIVSIRVERVQDISQQDAKAEGAEPWFRLGDASKLNPNHGGIEFSIEHCPDEKRDYVKGYSVLWDSINKKRGYSWESNPWTWVIEFCNVNEPESRQP